ncbi:MAG: hypothetical protein ACFE9T_07715 [Promethearchaeota archaeon]
MSILLIPVAPLSRTKSRLKDCFSREQLIDLTIAMFKDIANTLMKVNCFNEKLVYCNASEILEIAKKYGFIGIKEDITTPLKSFDEIIEDLNNIALNKYKAEQTILTFIDVILIMAKNFNEINDLLRTNQLVICPAINSAGISILGRKPPDIISSYFSEPNTPSLIALLNNAKRKSINNLTIYDSFRAGFDVDVKQDLVLAYEYLKLFNLKHTETYLFLKQNLKLTLRKINVNNNRVFKIIKKK